MRAPASLILLFAALWVGGGEKAHGLEPPGLSPWTLDYPSTPGSRLNAASWGPDGCVAVGAHHRILFSHEGTDWTEADPPAGSGSTEWTDVIHGAERFVAVGGDFLTGVVATSTDGKSWSTALSDHPAMLTSVVHTGGRFVAVGGESVISSADGLTWESHAPSPGLVDIAHGTGFWVGITGGGRSYRSEDLQQWSPTWSFPNFPSAHAQAAIAFGNGRFVIAGGYHSQGSGTSRSVLSWSLDGSAGRDAVLDDGEGLWGVLQDVTYANGRFIAVGSRTPNLGFRSLVHSVDGVTWTRGSVVFPHTVRGYVAGVAGASGRPFVAVSTTGEILISADGLDWALAAEEPREYFIRLHSADGIHVALAGQSGSIGGPLGKGMVFTSPDGSSWSARLPGLDEFYSGIAYGNGVWVATGDNGRILSSPDAVVWTDRSLPPTTQDLRLLAHGAGRFVALAAHRDRLYHSTDGITWTLVEQPFGDGPAASGANAIEFIDDRFWVVGDDGLVAWSEKGLSWHAESIHATADLRSIAFGKGRLVLGGSDHHAVAEGTGPFTVIAASGDDIAPNGIVYANGWFLSSDLRTSRDGVRWFRNPRSVFPAYGHWDHAVFTGTHLIACEGLEIRSLPFESSMPEALALDGGGAEFLTHPATEYRIQTSMDLGEWENPTGWQPGTGDFIIAPRNAGVPRAFWRLETRPAAPSP